VVNIRHKKIGLQRRPINSKFTIFVIMELILKKVQKKHLPLIHELAKMLRVEVEAKGESHYDPDFVAEILQAEQDIKDGKGVKIATQDLWK